MNRNTKIWFTAGGTLLFLFIALTVIVLTVDLQPIGPENSVVGLAWLNGCIASALGLNTVWYDLSEWLGLIAILVAAGFAGIGIYQWIKRKSFTRIDAGLLLLCIFYVALIAIYVLFEVIVVNYRPVIIGSGPEASFPSSHSMVVVFIMASGAFQANRLIPNKAAKVTACLIGALVAAFTVIGRLLSGVHWFTDILAGVLLGLALSALYLAFLKLIEYKLENKEARVAEKESNSVSESLDTKNQVER